MNVRLSLSLLAAATLLSGCNRLPTFREPAEHTPGAPTSGSVVSAPVSAASVATVPIALGAGKPSANLVGPSALPAFAALSEAERARIRSTKAIYLHQSVGQDLEDGAEANGFKFEYVGPDTHQLADGLNGGIFTDVGGIANGEPFKKMDVVRAALRRVKNSAKVVSFSFGYADIRDGDLGRVQDAYKLFVAEVKKNGAAFVHVTPPLVFSVEENPPKQKFRAFMLENFKDDIIFDLADFESQDGGKRCEVGGVWRICPGIRSTTSCSSKSQGIDGEGAGHICERRAKDIAKGLLYAFYLAGRR